MSERLTRRELKRDQFLEGVLTGLSWMREHLLVAVAAALVLVAMITLAVKIGGSAAGPSRGDVKAEKSLAEARSQFAKAGVPAGVSALEGVRDQHHGSRAAREATFLLANTYFETGEYAKAQASYEDFLKHPMYDDLLVDGAKLGIAASQEEQGNREVAAATYLEVWKKGTTPSSRLQGALGAARAYEADGKIDQALQVYQEAIDAYPEAPEAEEARFEKMRLEGLRPR